MKLKLFFITLLPLLAIASEPSIVDSRRNIPLADTDPIYKDYYINAGLESGLKVNSLVGVYRKLTIRDATGVQTLGQVKAIVGQIRIIYSQNNLSVARLYKLTDRENEPMLEQIGLMHGDLIDLDTITADKKK